MLFLQFAIQFLADNGTVSKITLQLNNIAK